MSGPDSSTGPANPLVMSVAKAAQLLQMEESDLRSDITAGAPVGPNDTINLLHYAAWLNAAPEGDGGD